MAISVTDIIELLTQIGVSLLIGTLLAIPIMVIYLKIKENRIRKRVPFDKLESERRFIENEHNKKEANNPRSRYSTADGEFIRKYTEDRTFNTDSSRSRYKPLVGENRTTITGTGTTDIERQLSTSINKAESRNNTTYKWS